MCDCVIGSFISSYRPDELPILEKVMDKPIAAQDRVVNSSFEILREPLLPESVQELTGGQGLKLRYPLAERPARRSLLSSSICQQKARQFEPQVAL